MISTPSFGLWAVHIADDFLSTPWLAGGFILAAVIAAASLLVDRFVAWWRQEELREEEIAYIAVLTSAFFVASLIHIRVGPTTVHLLLNGLLGVVLRWRAALAIPVGLLLQAALFGHGGFTTLGVNTCVMVLPALLAWLLFAGMNRLPWVEAKWFRSLLVVVCSAVWITSLLYSVALIFSNALLDLDEIDPTWANAVVFSPVTLVAVLAVSLLIAWIEPKLEHAPEFPLGLLIGVVTVLATLALNCLVLIYGGSENWRSVALITFVAHMPIAVLEGIVLGFIVGFLAKVKPAMLGLTRARGSITDLSESPQEMVSPSVNGEQETGILEKAEWDK